MEKPTPEEIDTALRDYWNDMCDDASPVALRIGVDALRLLKRMNLVTSDQVELWENRFGRCPGHGASRTWCAFCGSICRYCGLPYGDVVSRCQDLDHCADCCRLSKQDEGHPEEDDAAH